MSKNVFRVTELEDTATPRVYVDLAQGWTAIYVSGPDADGQWTVKLPVGKVMFPTEKAALAYGQLWANRAERASAV